MDKIRCWDCGEWKRGEEIDVCSETCHVCFKDLEDTKLEEVDLHEADLEEDV